MYSLGARTSLAPPPLEKGLRVKEKGCTHDHSPIFQGQLIEKNRPQTIIVIEKRIYREELKESLGMDFFSPLQPDRELKVYKSRKCSQIICSRVH